METKIFALLGIAHHGTGTDFSLGLRFLYHGFLLHTHFAYVIVSSYIYIKILTQLQCFIQTWFV